MRARPLAVPTMDGFALFLNPALQLAEDHIDYPYFTNYAVISGAARVARAGWRVEVVDAMALPGARRESVSPGKWRLGVRLSEVLRVLPEAEPDLVVIGASPFLHPWEPDEDLEALVSGLRARYQKTTVVVADLHVVGMHYVAYDPYAALRRLPGVDVVLQYAGERWLDEPRSLVGLRGRVIADPAAPWERPPPFPMYEAVDWAYHGAFLHRIFSDGTWANPFGIDATTRPFLTSSGCPHQCIFCTSNPGWRKSTGEGRARKVYRVVPLGLVADWAYLVRQVTGARKLFILDEMANLRPDFEDLLAVFNKLDLRYEFPNGLRADRLSDEAVARMVGHVGLLCVSPESGNEEDLFGPIGKRQSLREVERVLASAMRRGVPTLAHFVVGLPWETPAHVRRTLEVAWRLYESYGAMPAIQFATPIPGSTLFEECKARGLIPAEGLRWPDPTLFQHRPAYRPQGLPDGYLETAVRSLRQKILASAARKLIVNLTYECINRCVFCAVSNRVRRDVPWERVLAILRDHRQRGVDLLDLDGGEPTLHPRLFDLVREARTLGFRQVTVTTNARRLSDRRFARRLMASGVTTVLVSLHGSQAAIHESATRVVGSFDETVTGLRNVLALAGSNVSIGVNTTVFAGNTDDLEALGALILELGVETWNLQFMTPFGAASREVAPDPHLAAQAVRRVVDLYSDRIRIQVVNAQFCLFPPAYEPFLVADTQKLGRTMVFVTEEEVNLFKYIAARRRRGPECEACPRVPVCDGFYEFGEGEQDEGVAV